MANLSWSAQIDRMRLSSNVSVIAHTAIVRTLLIRRLGPQPFAQVTKSASSESLSAHHAAQLPNLLVACSPILGSGLPAAAPASGRCAELMPLPGAPPKSGSQPTLRWREMDSNPWSRLRYSPSRDRILLNPWPFPASPSPNGITLSRPGDR